MTKSRYGPASEQIRISRGPSTNPASLYHTSYASTYAHGVLVKKHSNQSVKNRPTGYNANFRPCIYYTPTLDDLDNRALKMDVAKHYQTGNVDDFRPYHVSPTGDELQLNPKDTLPTKSGFTTMNGKAFIEKSTNEVSRSLGRVCPQTGLSKIRKDPIAAENELSGPCAMSTENKTRYLGKQGRWTSQSWRFHRDIGCKEPTAATRIEPYEPIQGQPRNPYRHDISRSNYHRTNRPTGMSEQQAHFNKHPFHTSLPRSRANGIPEPIERAARNTGFCHETSKPRYTECNALRNNVSADNGDYLSATRPDAYTITLARCSFTAPGKVSPKLQEGLGSRHIGTKEATGFVQNHAPYQHKHLHEPSRWVTHYTDRYTIDCRETSEATRNRATLALSCGGWPVQKASNGYTKSTRVHAH